MQSTPCREVISCLFLKFERKGAIFMAEVESQQTTTEFQDKPAPHGDPNGIGVVLAQLAQSPSDLDDDRPARGISVIPIPRREIARLQGTFRLSELPRHKPTISFDAGRQFRDALDE
jgi:hypothetical protein